MVNLRRIVRRPQMTPTTVIASKTTTCASCDDDRSLPEGRGPRERDAVVEREELHHWSQVPGIRRQRIERRREEEHRDEGEAVDGDERRFGLRARGVGDQRRRERQRHQRPDEGQREAPPRLQCTEASDDDHVEHRRQERPGGDPRQFAEQDVVRLQGRRRGGVIRADPFEAREDGPERLAFTQLHRGRREQARRDVVEIRLTIDESVVLARRDVRRRCRVTRERESGRAPNSRPSRATSGRSTRRDSPNCEATGHGSRRSSVDGITATPSTIGR